MKKVAIIGVGLMGGSLGISLNNVVKNNKKQYEVLGIGRNIKSLKLALKKKAINNYSTDIKSVSNADIVVICTPVDTTIQIYKDIIKYIKPNCIVSDIGSIKQNVINKIESIRKKNKNSSVFVPSHPMAGVEQNGIKFANKNIYANATVVICSNNKESKVISKMWKDIGCNTVFIPAEQHDKLVAFSSHLPHIIAFNFYRMFKNKKTKNSNLEKIIAGSFNSITRVAKSSPNMWIPIFLNNKQNLKKLTKEFFAYINEFINCFDDETKLNKILKASINNENK